MDINEQVKNWLSLKPKTLAYAFLARLDRGPKELLYSPMRMR